MRGEGYRKRGCVTRASVAAWTATWPPANGGRARSTWHAANQHAAFSPQRAAGVVRYDCTRTQLVHLNYRVNQLLLDGPHRRIAGFFIWSIHWIGLRLSLPNSKGEGGSRTQTNSIFCYVCNFYLNSRERRILAIDKILYIYTYIPFALIIITLYL